MRAPADRRPDLPRWTAQSALDPVADFHLRNGASVLAVHWQADLSAAGRAKSYGMMVNYEYAFDALGPNSAAYRGRCEVHASPAVRELASGGEGS